MREVFGETIERGRITAEDRNTGRRTARGDRFGAFRLRHRDVALLVLASAGTEEIPWEHVSVSTKTRCPTWEEMSWVKSLFWDAEELVVQFHPPRSRHVNIHPFCLHLWKPTTSAIELPPSVAV